MDLLRRLPAYEVHEPSSPSSPPQPRRSSRRPSRGPLTAATNGGGVVALVTADLESQARRGRHRLRPRSLKRIPTAPGPRSIEAQRLRAGARRPHLGTAGSASSTPPRSRSSRELGGLREPRYTAMHPFERLAYVSDSKLRERRRRRPRPARRSSAASPFPAPPGISRSATDGRLLWVALGSKAARIASSTRPTRGGPALRRTSSRRSSPTTSSGRRAASASG